MYEAIIKGKKINQYLLTKSNDEQVGVIVCVCSARVLERVCLDWGAACCPPDVCMCLCYTNPAFEQLLRLWLYLDVLKLRRSCTPSSWLPKLFHQAHKAAGETNSNNRCWGLQHAPMFRKKQYVYASVRCSVPSESRNLVTFSVLTQSGCVYTCVRARVCVCV